MLYGLKQSPRARFERFTLEKNKFGYHQSNSDYTMFLKRRGEKKRRELISCLTIFVDDMIITGNDKEEIKSHKAKLFQQFEMKDLRRLILSKNRST